MEKLVAIVDENDPFVFWVVPPPDTEERFTSALDVLQAENVPCPGTYYKECYVTKVDQEKIESPTEPTKWKLIVQHT